MKTSRDGLEMGTINTGTDENGDIINMSPFSSLVDTEG